MSPRLRFALDHNFPRKIVDTIMALVPEAELLPLAAIDERGMLARLPDWKLLIALYRAENISGLVSMDEDFKAKPKELVTLEQTKLSVVVVAGVGHDPVRAAGLVLHKLPQICGQHSPRRGQLWYLASGSPDARNIRKELARIADRRKTTPRQLLDDHKLSKRQLDSEALDQLTVDE